MAINKELENQYQVKFNYHKIHSVRILTDEDGIQLRIVTASYANKEARKNGAKAVLTENIIQNADFAMNPFYALLKAKFPSFSDGLDDFDDAWKSAPGRVLYAQQTMEGQTIQQWTENKTEDEE